MSSLCKVWASYNPAAFVLMLNRGGTRLCTIPNHSLWCACGHNGGVRVAAILSARMPPDTVADAIAAMRCSMCRAQSINHYAITYEGGSGEAMQGTRN